MSIPVADYCDTPDEQAKNPDARRHFMEIAAGNMSAFNFMWTFWNFTHLYDDLVDNDKPVSVEQAARGIGQLMEQLSFNPFYTSNMRAIFPHIMSTLNRWCDGEDWEQNGTADQIKAASVVKCGDIDLYLNIAYLIGGWEHMRAMKHARSYDPIDRKE